MRAPYEAKGDRQHEKDDDGRLRDRSRQTVFRGRTTIASKNPPVHDGSVAADLESRIVMAARGLLADLNYRMRSPTLGRTLNIR
jgi:hypothetical protein